MNTTNMTCLIKNCLQKRAFFFNNEALEKARKNFHNCKKQSNKLIKNFFLKNLQETIQRQK